MFLSRLYIKSAFVVGCAAFVAALLLARASGVRSAPNDGYDCMSSTSGSWNAPTTWYACGDGVPGQTDNAYVQSGHIIALTQDAAVRDLHISTGQASATSGAEGSVALGQFTLNLYGKLRNYYGPLGVTPGTSTMTLGPAPITMTAGGSGRLRIAGSSRNLTEMGEWSANNLGATTAFAAEVALSPNQTVTLQTNIKASNWLVASGALDAGTNRISVDIGVTAKGDITVAAGATLISSVTSSSIPVFSRSATARAGVLTVLGTLVLKGNAPFLAMETIDFSGVVEYSAAGGQLLASAGGSGAIPNVYNDLVLANSGAKTLASNTTVTGILTRAGAALLQLGPYVLTYAPGAGLEYAGSVAQTTGPEFDSGSIDRLIVANPLGVTLSGDRTVATALALDSGDLTTEGNTLTLGATATCAGEGEAVGAVTRQTIVAGVPYCFGNPNVQVAFAAGSTVPTTLTVVLEKGATPFTGALPRQYTISAPGFAGSAALRLYYSAADLNGADPAQLQLWRLEGSQWLLHARTGAGAGYVEKDGVAGFSSWALANNGAPTAVTLKTFEAYGIGPDVKLAWTTATELDSAGFNLYRSPAPDGPPVRLNTGLIPAHDPGSIAGSTYSWEDHAEQLWGARYEYWLEAVDFEGATVRFGPARVTLARVYLPWAGKR